MANPCLTPNAADFRGYPFQTYSREVGATFRRNNCGAGMIGSAVPYSKTYTSQISENHLEYLIELDRTNFNNEGQANANANGTCSPSCPPSTGTPPGYGIIGLSATQLWVVQYPVEIPFSPYSRSFVDSGANLPSANYLTNYSPSGNPQLYSGWRTMWPHSSAATLYNVHKTDSNQIMLETVPTSSPCIAPSTTILSGVSLSGYMPVSFLAIGNSFYNGLIYILHKDSHYEVYWRNFNNNADTLLATVNRPVSNYSTWGGMVPIVCTGSAIFIWLAWDDNTRSRGYIYRVTAAGGVPGGWTQVHDFGYSDQDVTRIAGTNIGERAYFIWEEGGSMRSFTLGGAAIPPPPGAMTTDGGSFIMGDSAGTVMYAGKLFWRVLCKYTASSNSWTTIRSS